MTQIFMGQKSRNRFNLKTRAFFAIGALLFLILGLINFRFKILDFRFIDDVRAASAPSIITYQGKLLVNGLNATTTQSMKFVLYDSPTGGTALYTASGTLPTTSTINVTPSNGLFSVNLGDTGTNSLDSSIFQTNQNVYLEVTINGETMTPRKQITASPYSYNSKYLDGVAPSSTAPNSQFIPLTDSSGNLNLRNVTSTGLTVSNGTLLVDNPATPTLVGSYNTPHHAVRVYVSGKYAYVADTDSGLQIIDVSNPASPTLTGTYNTSGNAHGVHVSGKYAYVADSSAGLQIINISNPSSPILTGTYYSGTGYTMNVYVAGKYAYVVNRVVINDPDNPGFISNLEIIDIGNPSSPMLTGTYTINGGAVRDVYVSGQYAYVTSLYGGLLIIDISNPASPNLAAVYDEGSQTSGIYISGKYAYITNIVTSSLQIVDISDPSAPELSGMLSLSGYAGKLSVAGKYAYIAGGSGGGFQIVDISNPADPVLVGIYETNSVVIGLYISGKYAFLANGAAGLEIIDIKGADIHALSAGNVATNDLTITENANIGNNLYVSNGLNVGPGGILSNGALSISATNTASYFGGSVGIGTTTPAAALQINNSSSTLPGLIVQAASGQETNIAEFRNSDGTALAYIDQNGGLTVTGTSTLVTTTIAGFLGIGTTTASGWGGDVLNVNGVSNFTDRMYFAPKKGITYGLPNGNAGTFSIESVNGTGGVGRTNINSGSTGLYFTSGSGASTHFITIRSGGLSQEAMTIDSNGLVGIGTTTPAAALQILNSSSTIPGLIVQAASGQSTNLAEFRNSAGTPLVYIDQNGGLTVTGTTTLATSTISALTVSGASTFTGTSTFSNALIFANDPTYYVNSLGEAAFKDLVIPAGGGITLGGETRTVWPSGIVTSSIFATSSNNLVLYPAFSSPGGPSALVIGASVTTSNSIFEVVGNSKLNGALTVTGNSTFNGRLGLVGTAPHNYYAVYINTTTESMLFGISSAVNRSAVISSGAFLGGISGGGRYTGSEYATSTAIGVYGAGGNMGTGGIRDVKGGYFIAHNSGTSSVGEVIGLDVDIWSSVQSTVGNMYGLKITAYPGSGDSTINTGYGIYVGQMYGDTNYGLYQAGAANQNYFAGNVGIGTTTTLAALQVLNSSSTLPGLIVQGAADQSANLTEFHNSAGTALVYIDQNGGLTVTGTSTLATTTVSKLIVDNSAISYSQSIGMNFTIGTSTFLTATITDQPIITATDPYNVVKMPNSGLMVGGVSTILPGPASELMIVPLHDDNNISGILFQSDGIQSVRLTSRASAKEFQITSDTGLNAKTLLNFDTLTGNGYLAQPLRIGSAGTPGYTVDVQGTFGVSGTSTLPGGIWGANGFVGIGTTTPSAALTVEGNVQFSTGTYFKWDNTNKSLVVADQNAVVSDISSFKPSLYASKTINDPAQYHVLGLEVLARRDETSGANYGVWGIFSEGSVTGTASYLSVRGIYSNASNRGEGTVTDLTGYHAAVAAGVGSVKGASTNAIGFKAGMFANGNTVENMISFYSPAFTNSSGPAPTNAYGLKIDAPGIGTNQWTAFFGTGNSAIKGSLVIGASSTPGYTVDVQGTLGVTGNSTLATTTISSLSVTGTSSFNGGVNFGTDFSWSASTNTLTLGKASDLAGSSASPLRGGKLNVYTSSLTGDDTSYRSAVNIWTYVNPTSTSANSRYYGIYNFVNNYNAPSGLTMSYLAGIENTVALDANNTMTSAYGSRNIFYSHNGIVTSSAVGAEGYSIISGGTFNNAIGVRGRISASGGSFTNLEGLRSDVTITNGTITNASGLYIKSFTGPFVGSLTNAYGLLVDAPGIGANQWTAGFGTGNSYFEGSLAVGGKVTSTAALTINGQSIFGTTTNPGTYQVFIDSGDSASLGLGVNGQIKASGFITENDTLDLAEQYPINPNCSASGTCPEAGDVVCLADNNGAIEQWSNTQAPETGAIEKCSSAYSSKTIGIISTNPGFTLGGLSTSSTRKVALSGRVPVKVSTQNGPIKVGDRLTSSDIPGVAIKALTDGEVVAIALEDFDDNTSTLQHNSTTTLQQQQNNTPTIIAFVKLGLSLPSLDSPADSPSTTITTDTGLFGTIISWFKQIGITIQNGIITAKEFVAEKIVGDKIIGKELCAEDICVTRDQLKQLLEQSGSIIQNSAPMPQGGALSDGPVSGAADSAAPDETMEGVVSSPSESVSENSEESLGGSEPESPPAESVEQDQAESNSPEQSGAGADTEPVVAEE